MDGPRRYEVKPPRMNEMAAWLRCNDVDPADVPYPSAVFIETVDGAEWRISYEAYERSAEGRIVWDPVGLVFTCVERTAVLSNDPPMGWLMEVLPTTSGSTS